jgi:inositol phosphorylceramide mannosyltransferase catalytic subunit
MLVISYPVPLFSSLLDWQEVGMIPRILHQIWLRGGEQPSVLQRNVENLKLLNPGWEHRLWTSQEADELLASYDDEIAEAYYRIDPRYGAARADLLRHLIIYRHGGVYCDIKSGFLHPLNDVLRADDEYILCRVPSLHKELPKGELLTHFVIATPTHPFSASVVHKILCNIKDYRPWHAVGRNGVLRTTGPIAYTLAIDRSLDGAPHRFVTQEEIGSYFSIDCDHMSAFPNHYSTLTEPVVKMGAARTAMSGLFARLRSVARSYVGAKWLRRPSTISSARTIRDASLTSLGRPSSTLP